MYLATVSKVHICSQKDEENKKRYSWQKNTRNRSSLYCVQWVILIYIFFFQSSDIDKPKGYLVKMSCEMS